MAQLRVLAALVESCSVSRTRVWQLTTACDSNFKGSDPSFDF